MIAAILIIAGTFLATWIVLSALMAANDYNEEDDTNDHIDD